MKLKQSLLNFRDDMRRAAMTNRNDDEMLNRCMTTLCIINFMIRVLEKADVAKSAISERGR